MGRDSKEDVVLQQFYGDDVDSRLLCTFGSSPVSGGQRETTAYITEKRLKPSISLRKLFMSIFLPQGYPNSVSDDYLAYQIWDTVQAFASSLSGALATHAVLTGIGVGDESASAISATVTWLMKDGLGMVTRIMFTWFKGTSLDCNCKRWRLFADIMNDTAISVEILASSLGPFAFRYFACAASMFRSLVGVAGGATRTALTQHQARRNNLADVAAKDGSQETLVNLAALLCNLVLVPVVTRSSHSIALVYILCTILHLFANYRAVRSVRMRFFNVDRLLLALHSFITSQSHSVGSIDAINRKEPVVFGYDLRFTVHLGAPLATLPNLATQLLHQKQTGSSGSDRRYFVDLVRHSPSLLRLRFIESYSVRIALHRHATNRDQLAALIEYYLLRLFLTERLLFDSVCHQFGESYSNQPSIPASLSDRRAFDVALMERCAAIGRAMLPKFIASCENAGWHFDLVAFGTDEWRFAYSNGDLTGTSLNEFAHPKVV